MLQEQGPLRPMDRSLSFCREQEGKWEATAADVLSPYGAPSASPGFRVQLWGKPALTLFPAGCKGSPVVFGACRADRCPELVAESQQLSLFSEALSSSQGGWRPHPEDRPAHPGILGWSPDKAGGG